MAAEQVPVSELPDNKKGFEQHIDIIINHCVVTLACKYKAYYFIQRCYGYTKNEW